MSGTERTHKHKTNLGDCPGTGWVAKVMFVCVCVFWGVIAYGGKETHKHIPSENPRKIPRKVCLCVSEKGLIRLKNLADVMRAI